MGIEAFRPKPGETREVDLTKKRDKAEAAYRLGGVGADNCANCQHSLFEQDAQIGACSKVQGQIERPATCDLFLSKQIDA